MAYEQRDNSGSAFPNNRKEKDTHADWTGTVMIDGAEYWINGWWKKDRNDNDWLSFSFRKKEGKSEGRSAPRQEQRGFGNRPEPRGRPSSPASQTKPEPQDEIPW